MNWKRIRGWFDRLIPTPAILHSYPNDRLYAKHPKKGPYAVQGNRLYALTLQGNRFCPLAPSPGSAAGFRRMGEGIQHFFAQRRSPWYAVMPHLRICAGRRPKRRSLPRPID